MAPALRAPTSNRCDRRSLDNPNGKILRIRTDGSAPSDNPFYDGTNSWRSRIWLYGVRNPFGFSIHPDTGEIFLGDVGWNTWEEVNHGGRATNFGWPCFEGMSAQNTYQGLFPGTCGPLSPGAVKPPFYTYDHSAGSAAIGGPIYTGSLYPTQYYDSFFFSDYSGNFIRRLTLDEDHQPVSQQLFASDVPAPVAITQGPDGMLYYLSFTEGELRRIRYNGVAAHASGTPTHGHSPLQVSFSSAGTQNPGGGTLTYAWDFGDGGTSSAANPTHTYTTSTVRTFTARLTATNSAGQSSTDTVPITVGSVPPVPTIVTPTDGTPALPGQTVQYSGSATDPEDGPIAPSALTWTVLLHHNTHVHTHVGDVGASGSFVPENHGPIGTFSYEVILTATDSSGLQGSTSVNIPVVSDTSPPLAPSGLAATAAASNRVDLTWSAATDNAAIGGYRIERCSGAGCTNFADVGSPSSTTFADNGVAGSTTYRYRVRAVDASGNLGPYSNVAEATTAVAPPIPPGLVGAWAFGEGFGSTTADASGNSNTGTISNATWTSQGRYGNALDFNGADSRVRVPSSSSLNVTSAMTLSGWIRPTDTQGGWRTIMQKETDTYFLNASNSNGPLRPSGGAVIGGGVNWISGPTSSPVNTWTHVALTYDGTTIRLFVNGTQVASTPQTGAISTTNDPLWIGGNSPYGEYFEGLIDEVRVYNRALSAADIQADMNTSLVPTAPDTTAPSTPTGLSSSATGSTAASVSWSASSDNVGVTGYRVERCLGASCTDFAEVGTPTGTSFGDTGLTASSTYRYRVRAVDQAGNLSGYSLITSATTPAPPDTAAPTAPTGLTATVLGATQVELAWTASSDNVGVTGYRIERCQGSTCTNFTQIGTSSAPNFSNTGLTVSTNYRYRVRAIDAAGNLSGYSNIAAASTPGVPDTTAPTAPTALSSPIIAFNHVDLSWSASTDNVGVTSYHLERCIGPGCTGFAEIAAPNATTFNDGSVAPSTNYRYRVRAADDAGNLSGYSTIIDVTTAATPPAPTGLVGAWGFDEGAGVTTADSSGNGNVATIVGASWTTQGRFGDALTFDGASTVRVPSSPSLSVTTGMTLSAWIRPTVAQSGWRTIMQKETDTYFLNASNQNGPLLPSGGGLVGGGVNWISGSTASPVNAWTHVALTYDGTALRLFVNATQVATTPQTGAISTSADPLWIGGNNPYGEYFTGLIDEARVYSRALSASELQADMNTSIVPTGPDTTPPAAPTGLTAGAASSTAVNVSWTASSDNVGVSGYRVERCLGAGCTNFVEVGTQTGTTFNDSGLDASSAYRYRVRATDLAGNLSAYSSETSVTTPAPPDTSAPTAPSGVVADPVSTTRIDLTWAAATDNVGVTEYRIERCAGTTCTNFAQVATSTTLGFSNTGLTGNTTYRFRVRAVDAAGNLGSYSAIVTTATPAPPDTTAPTAPTGLTTTPVSPTQINLSWTASTDNVGVTGYRVERCQGAGCTTFSEIATPASPGYDDTGRSPSTVYRYRARAIDAAGNLGTYSTIVTGTTPAVPDTTAPSAPTGPSATPASSAQINVGWTASTDNVGVTGYRVERCQGAGCTNFVEVATPATTTFNDTGRAESTTYRYRVRAADAAGNLSDYSSIVSATTPAAPDTTAPTVPTGVTATAASPTQVGVSWTASTDSVGVTGYRVERCQGVGCTTFAEVTTASGTSFDDAGRSPGTLYRYRVRATDAAGNLSGYSAIANATTPDTSPPTAPTSLGAAAAGSSQANLAWTASTDDVGVSGYRVERCAGAGCTTFAEIATPSGATYGDAGLSASTLYRYRVRAADAAGNLGPYSNIAEATTSSAPAIPQGLVGAWGFGEGSGGTTADASGNGNAGTINGATWTTQGRYGDALNFNGTNTTVRVAASASLNVTTAMTLSAWIRPSASQGGWRTVLQREVDSYFLNASNDSGPLRPSGGGTFGNATDWVGGPTASPVNAWTHVALTYDGTIMRLYVDGTQVATKPRTGTVQSSPNPLWIGGNSPYGEYFDGLLDDVRIYNRALIATEIQTDMNTPLNWSGLPSGLL